MESIKKGKKIYRHGPNPRRGKPPDLQRWTTFGNRPSCIPPLLTSEFKTDGTEHICPCGQHIYLARSHTRKDKKAIAITVWEIADEDLKTNEEGSVQWR